MRTRALHPRQLLRCIALIASVQLFAPLALAEGEDKSGSCVTVRTEARNVGFGFSHLVHLQSACKEAMVCSVRTNVNPGAKRVKLAPGEKTTVTTFLDSPSRVFEAQVSCEPR